MAPKKNAKRGTTRKATGSWKTDAFNRLQKLTFAAHGKDWSTQRCRNALQSSWGTVKEDEYAFTVECAKLQLLISTKTPPPPEVQFFYGEEAWENRMLP
jgi:hypothetical protein